MPDVVLPIPNAPRLKIVQQDDGKYGFVSEEDNVVTQFSMPKNIPGSETFLAHNYKAGKLFNQLKIGDNISVVSNKEYKIPVTRGKHTRKVKNIYKFIALSPTSPKSDFLDVVTNKRYTANELYKMMYETPNTTTLQTCIENNGDLSWGRLFVLAE